MAEATPRPARPRRPRRGPNKQAGAYVVDHGRRRRKLGWLWLLLALLALALLLSLLLRGCGDGDPVAAASTSASPSATAPSSPAPDTAPPEPTAADPSATAPTTTPPTGSGTTPTTTTDSTPAGGTGTADLPADSVLVGGGTVPVHAATGADAVAGAAGTALFGTGSATLDAPGRRVVAAAAQRIRATKPGSVTVTGYADQVGGQPASTGLSQRRADAVATELRADLGAAAPTITTAARGQQDPVASNATAAGRQLNRRATITTGPATTGATTPAPTATASMTASTAGAALIGAGPSPPSRPPGPPRRRPGSALSCSRPAPPP